MILGLKNLTGQDLAPQQPVRYLAWLVLAFLVPLNLPACAQGAAFATQGTAPRSQAPNPARQDPAPAEKTGTPPTDREALQVNWLYGSFVPKNVPLIPLTGKQRWKLYVRSTYTTPGIYIKTVGFTLSDQIKNVPEEWGKTFDGFAKRVGTRETQFVLQNSFQAYGNAALGWEPRYDRCRCEGFWPRTRHAIARNFVTYGGAKQALRPQIMPYVAAFGGGAIAATWIPGTNVLVRGYQGAIAQVFVGVGSDWLAEFAPEIMHALHIKKGLD